VSFKFETELTVECIHCTNSPAVFWPKRQIWGGWICGFNLSPLVVRLRVRVVRWRENLHRGR